ncbi:hypothetical protein AR1Y2_1663 [Anaerostipes rhamnosivorans]|uniref:Uncharacterized protein n=1 Tax=Anaerostipes rhamnosivorans TaxID=1229621 RepID=A0A4P8IEN1_9FIRM|nr:hypothetical protein AR1Y2_1663 [Anaerostipes rhamnosivorans]
MAKHIRRLYRKKLSILIIYAYDWSDIEKEALDAGVRISVKAGLFLF